MSERQASRYRHGTFTSAHVRAMSVLGEMGVQFMAEYPLMRPNEFTFEGKPKSYSVDILICDPRFGTGAIEINGLVHHKEKQRVHDLRKKDFLLSRGIWFEEVDNESVSLETFQNLLGMHVRARDEYSP